MIVPLAVIAPVEGSNDATAIATWSVSGQAKPIAIRPSASGAPIAPGRVRLGDDTSFPRAFVEHVEERDGDGNLIRENDVVRVLGSRPGMFVAFRGVCGTEM